MRILILLLIPFGLFGQDDAGFAKEIKSSVYDLMASLSLKDSSKVRKAFVKNPFLRSVYTDKSGKTILVEETLDKFIASIPVNDKVVLEEQLSSIEVKIDYPLATAWAPYRFLVDHKISHCGTNCLQLIHQDGIWKIVGITDTRKRSACDEWFSPKVEELKERLNKIMDKWHGAASDANLESYFYYLANDSRYLGTDASERWSYKEFYYFCEPHFKKGKAWSFKATDRHWAFDDNNEMAWFDEVLDTWMGPCRGSGVLKFVDGEWKIMQYNLAVLVPNDLIESYLKIYKNFSGEKKKE